MNGSNRAVLFREMGTEAVTAWSLEVMMVLCVVSPSMEASTSFGPGFGLPALPLQAMILHPGVLHVLREHPNTVLGPTVDTSVIIKLTSKTFL